MGSFLDNIDKSGDPGNIDFLSSLSNEKLAPEAQGYDISILFFANLSDLNAGVGNLYQSSVYFRKIGPSQKSEIDRIEQY